MLVCKTNGCSTHVQDKCMFVTSTRHMHAHRISKTSGCSSHAQDNYVFATSARHRHARRICKTSVCSPRVQDNCMITTSARRLHVRNIRDVSARSSHRRNIYDNSSLTETTKVVALNFVGLCADPAHLQRMHLLITSARHVLIRHICRTCADSSRLHSKTSA